jgi:hypothetical protein
MTFHSTKDKYRCPAFAVLGGMRGSSMLKQSVRRSSAESFNLKSKLKNMTVRYPSWVNKSIGEAERMRIARYEQEALEKNS